MVSKVLEFKFVAVTLLIVQGVLGRPDGLPWPNSCESMSPGNDILPQTSECPFKLTVDDQETTCDGVIYVTIKGPEPEEFAGFMVQARTKEGKAVGKFLSGDDIKLMDCFGNTEVIQIMFMSLFNLLVEI